MKAIKFDHTHTLKYGGYKIYLGLYFRLWTMLIKVKVNSPMVKFMNGIMLIVLTPWYILVKPLGCMFGKVTVSKGICKINDDETILLSFDAEKFVTHKFLGIPFVAYCSTKFSEEEKLRIAGLKND
jgi:hypothetical protein